MDKNRRYFSVHFSVHFSNVLMEELICDEKRSNTECGKGEWPGSPVNWTNFYDFLHVNNGFYFSRPQLDHQ